MSDTRTRSRLFFALMPPAEVSQQIVERRAARQVGGRVVPVDQLHMTLRFVGSVDVATRDMLIEHADGLRCAAFFVRLSEIGCFTRPGIVWLGPRHVPPALLALVAELNKITVQGIVNNHFKPHVTLARKASPVPARSVAPVEWPVRHFSLMVSGANGAAGAYRELRRWRLEPPSAAQGAL